MCDSGSSIIACRNVNRHIAAFEPDTELFKAVIAPLIHQGEEAVAVAEDLVTNLDDISLEDPPVDKIVKKSRFAL